QEQADIQARLGTDRVVDATLRHNELLNGLAPQNELAHRFAAGLAWVHLGVCRAVTAELLANRFEQRLQIRVGNKDVAEQVHKQSGEAVGGAMHEPISVAVSDMTRLED